MAKKIDIFNSAIALCKEHKASEKLVAGLTDLLAPKTAGQHVDLEKVTKKDNSGKIVEIQCQVSGKFLPATVAFFYEETKEGKGIKGTDGVALRRLSRQAESIRKEFNRKVTASKNAITDDVMAGKIKLEEGNALIAKLAKAPDFSSVSAKLPEPKAPEAK